MRKELKTSRGRGRKKRLLLGASLAILIGAVIVGFLLVPGGKSTNSEPRIPSDAPLSSWRENGRSGQYVLQILAGNVPPAGVTVTGVVATDTDCQPDAQGINHCHNEIDLANGTNIMVINNHVMKRYRCLNPGEPISLTRINASWIMAKVSNP